VQYLKELQQQGIGIQAISERTGWDRKTIHKYVRAAGERYREPHDSDGLLPAETQRSTRGGSAALRDRSRQADASGLGTPGHSTLFVLDISQYRE